MKARMFHNKIYENFEFNFFIFMLNIIIFKSAFHVKYFFSLIYDAFTLKT
jgi:hypothetical protein